MSLLTLRDFANEKMVNQENHCLLTQKTARVPV